jgi:dihydrolipoamide dehydrogenase
MKKYDLIAIGTGSAMNIVSAVANSLPELKIAVIDKDEPGGICLTKGCIPTKILLYPADVVRIIQRAKRLGITTEKTTIHFQDIMERMRHHINEDIQSIKKGLSSAEELDYYQEIAEFVEPYTLKVGNEKLKGKTILLCSGSKPLIPPIKGLEKVPYHTSDTILQISELPESICIIGGGYIAAEYGHFFSSMGSEVTIIGRNKYLVKEEEPEVSTLLKKKLAENMNVHTSCEVISVDEKGKKKIIEAKNNSSKEKLEITADEILVATGRISNNDILKPEKGDIETNDDGWIKVNDYLETSKKNIYAFGDANGKYLFKHVANYESQIVYQNIFHEEKASVDYHAIPHAVFSDPEIASVGMREEEAINEFGEENILIGFQRYQETAKGIAMEIEDYFVKIIVNKKGYQILGAHIIGPQASVLIQEIINLMYTRDQSILPLVYGIHIHPALSEVVDRAAGNLMPVEVYHQYLHHYNLEADHHQ